MKELVFAALAALSAPKFPAWEAVTVQEILKPVPEYAYPDGGLGAVSRPSKAAALPSSCAIKEGSKVVGYRLNC